MTFNGILQIIAFLLVLTILTKPVGIYLTRVYSGETTFLQPIERAFYWLTRVDAGSEMNWKQYGVAMLLFSMVSTIAVYAIQRMQSFLPFNPQALAGPSPDSSFNTAVSFVTNTNWQGYSGESTMSYFTQMAGLTVQNFASAAVGMALAVVFIRGISRFDTDKLGNFWTDLLRGTLYVLLPISFLAAIFFVSQGVVQNFKPYDTIPLIDSRTIQVDKKDAAGAVIKDANGDPVKVDKRIDTQTIAQGPVASQLAIKMLGTNGGGFFNANSAHPFENPTPLTNFVEMLLILIIPAGFTYMLGRMVKSKGHGWAVYAAMMFLLIAGVTTLYWAEANGNPLYPANVDQSAVGGNFEGKETRFGIAGTALFATVTTDASCGAVNAMHDSLTPIGGLVPMVNMQLGEIIFGGVGAGMYGILIMIILTVFLAGLMVGRTPEYLGKKIEAYDVQMATLYVLIFPLTILGFAAISSIAPDFGLASLNNAGAHGLSEILYAFSSGTGNNGSAFAGLSANTLWYNSTLGTAMLLGRFFMIIPMLAIAGNLARKKLVPASLGTFPVNTALFSVLLVSVILILGALTFFPVLSLSPILEHFQMTAGQTF
ncbi:MAG TPA: potassium-transporting ATPase subunit KdpA [Pyrinomonadaceae bacterium]|nr:potassium-transporting ATPase subunit KdpA [Chloracidobacterium sp.]MBL0240017.1 potassium-transporting ATPase subunit KdpA [Chloracidobacterium sp.]MBP9934525.1 potassium-transporting ATPase subunit KdpA [Pyrinomonadaceae bacterium]HQY67024.1 potassium-transporting ATPase subunit KdpA [Pyrinomonadaceae bacterium]HRA41864.1 potassium-transporting ATPase subunit KdpA [Pyrinomonadaceae bacterium]